MTPEQFTIAINKWAKGGPKELAKFTSSFCLELSSRIVEATPVKTGNLKSQWRASLNSVPSGDGAGSSAASTLSTLKIGDSFYFANHAAYAVAVEFGSVAHYIFPKGPPEGASVLHWKAGGKDIFAAHVWHPGYVGAAFVRGVMNQADDIAQDVANNLGTSDSNLITGS